MSMMRIKLLVLLIVISATQCLSMSHDEIEDFKDYLSKTSQLDQILKKGPDLDDEYDEEESPSDHAWEDSGKFEGDLILNDQQRRLIVKNVAEGLSRNGLKDTTKRWPNNEVVYYIQGEHFNGDQLQAIQQGIDDIGQASCVKFRPYKKGDRDAVVIQGSRRGCFSQVGYQGGYQILNLSGRHPVGRGCFRHGTVVHELLHTLGFYHMQSSPDRDDYIDVRWENILQPSRHNFRKYNSFAVSDFGVGYDYDSVLHYSRRAFSANGQDTLVPKQNGADIGQRVGLSDKDTKKLNKMYCDADSDNPVPDESDTTHKTLKKKNDKNKPFDGHGIGYHQGKTVVIKLSPTPETYKLLDVPIFYLFDYFSKAPQAMPQTDIEGNRGGKEITYPPLVFYSEANSKTDDSETIDNQQEDLNDPDSPFKNKPNIVEDPDHLSPDEEKESSIVHMDGDLNDAFDRLEKIVKQHVYPSHTPNLNVYKTNYKNTNQHYTQSKMIDKDNSLTSLSPAIIIQGEGMKSTVNFIDGLYEKRRNDDKTESAYNPGEVMKAENKSTGTDNIVGGFDTLRTKPIENEGETQKEDKRGSENTSPEYLLKGNYNVLYHPKPYAKYAENAPIVKDVAQKHYEQIPKEYNPTSYLITDNVDNVDAGIYFNDDYNARNINNLQYVKPHPLGFTGAVAPFRLAWNKFDDVHDNFSPHRI